MPGVKGAGGPVPKRSDRRLGHRPKDEVDKVTMTDGAAVVEVPDPDPSWHPVAERWFRSLGLSGQHDFYEPSDWASAFLLAESMSRELNPQPVIDKDGNVTMVSMPPKAAAVAAWLKGMTALLATEGDRRRAAVELQRPQGEEVGDVAWIDDARSRLRSG